MEQNAPSLDQPRNSDLDRLVFDLVMKSGAAVEAQGELATAVRFPNRRLALIVPWVPGREAQLEAKLPELMSEAGKSEIVELLLLGGPAEAQKLLAKARPSSRRKTVVLYHRADSGAVWDPNSLLFGEKPLGKHLKAHPLTGPSSAEDEQRFKEKLAEAERRQAELRGELEAFGDMLRQRRPLATWTLVGLISAVFAAQYALDSTESVVGLARMGALIPENVRQGEWWRLLSSSFLHGGFMHFALNTYVLLVIGSSLERILGTGRFLAVYGLSALGGSLVSLAVSDAPLTVGASGGIWGLLVAEGVLALRPRGLLPQAVQQQARNNFFVNLVINVVNSFRPNVAMAAHFGGGAVGGLLLLGSFFVRGLPRLDVPASGVGLRPQRPAWVVPLAGATAAMLALSLVVGFASGKPWLLLSPPELERRSVEKLGLSAELPALLPERPEDSEPQPGAQTVIWGSLLHFDPAVVGLTVVTFPEPIAPEAFEAEMQALLESLRKVPEGGRVEVEPASKSFGERPGATVRYAYAGDVKADTAFVVMPDRLWKVEVVYWPNQAPYWGGLADRIAGSIRDERR